MSLLKNHKAALRKASASAGLLNICLELNLPQQHIKVKLVDSYRGEEKVMLTEKFERHWL